MSCRQLFRRLRRVPYARSEYRDAFKPVRDPVVRAQRAIMRSFASIHHSALFKRSGSFAARYGEARVLTSYPRHLASICRRLRGVVIECQDALEIIRVHDAPDTLFFVDPPYMPSLRASGVYRCEMDEATHVKLLETLRTIKGRAMLTGYPSDLYDRMLPDWTRLERKHYARSCQRIRKATEVLWISPPNTAI